MGDRLRCVRPGGVVCVAGIVDGVWTVGASRNLMEEIPTAARLITFGGGPEDLMRMPLSELMRAMATDGRAGGRWRFLP
jgi:hypothetical protein